MRTQVSILHDDYPARVRELIDEKLQRLVKFDRVVSMRALAERIKGNHRVEIVANVGQGAVLVADAQEDAFNSALDAAMDRMTRQLKRHHDKWTKNRHRADRSDRMAQ